MEFYPIASLTNANQICFLLPRFTGPNCYLPNDLILQVETQLTKADGATKPDDGATVAPINNCLHSLFRTLRIYLNDLSITKSAENYAFKV